jgi:GTP-binding protein EngB required for normal cell division
MNPDDYQRTRKTLLARIETLREIRDDLTARDPLLIGEFPADVRQKMVLLDRESTRLRNPNLTVAFVGGFSAGKSSLVNAFLGRYLLPESTKVTTAVPTFVREASEGESAELHYLSETEIEELGQIFRQELATIFRMPELANAPHSTLVETLEPLVREGRGRVLFEQYRLYQEHKSRRNPEHRGRVLRTTLDAARKAITDETDAMFLDRVVLNVQGSSLPADVVLVDLPGISVANPRHRQITFRFVREEAHAVVFVLLATRLFDKDEIEILELIRAGESRIAEKTFWVMNRWDALGAAQQQQTLQDFEKRMQEFSIPAGYSSFRTNALHGLLAQMGLGKRVPSEPVVTAHWRGYEELLATRYGGSHQTAFHDSQIHLLQEKVLDFLNNRLRLTTLRTAIDNARSNFGEPVPHQLRRVKDAEEASLAGGLKQAEQEHSRQMVDSLFERRQHELESLVSEMQHEVAVERAASLNRKTQELVESLKGKIESGSETNAFEVYKDIIASRELRKYPYHFEIEMRVVDNLNTMLKRSFRAYVQEQVTDIFQNLVRRVNAGLEGIGQDIGFNTGVMEPFDAVLKNQRTAFIQKVDGVAMMMAVELDALLLYKPKSFWGYGGNEILEGLEVAARINFASIQNPNQPIEPADFEQKTKKIRETLSKHYIGQVVTYYNNIAKSIFPIVISNLQEIREKLIAVLKSHYRHALASVKVIEAEKEYSARRQGAEQRSRYLRETIDRIEQAGREMASQLPALPA